ncbi:MAG: cytochrome b5 domain-containing protein, partial [Actinobacteria bacterium]|nr:cytochrome b5 domain-containing protein [Actinomycetota bacterium]
MEQLFDTVNGIPAHVLVVHVVVVLLPVSALGALAIAAVPRWSAQFGPFVWVAALISTGASVVAEESG